MDTVPPAFRVGVRRRTAVASPDRDLGVSEVLERREIECLLTLREELHFGRAARQLHVSQSRVSQTVRSVEERIGGRLFERTSRRVRLTALGDSFTSRLLPLYQQLVGAYDEAVARARRPAGTVRLGFSGPDGGQYAAGLLRITRTSAPECEVALYEVPAGDLLGPLRRDEVDVLVTPLPVEEPDLTVGPVIAHEPRLLAVPSRHRAATRPGVSIEEVAGETMFAPATTAPDYWWDFHLPSVTPRGREVRRRQRVRTYPEILFLVAAGRGVAPLPELVARHHAQPDVVFVPILDLPAVPVATVWRTAEDNARIRTVVESSRRLADELRRARVRPTPVPTGARTR